ncbi:MAG: hydroxyquinol 1,2-dioxygenase [Gammaproteobacteria bacterium]
MNARTKFGSLAQFEKGAIEITGKETPGRYLFSNMFEVAGNAAPWERTVVAKNLEFSIEVSRTEGASPWYICAHDETVLVMEGELEVHFIKPAASDVVPPDDTEGAVRLAGEPEGARMGHIAAKRGHLILLPAGAAYQVRSTGRGVALYQSAQGEESIEKWAEICLR